jgi:ABC-type glycerol-3-phosphate transport system substrate-binding protein
MEVESTSTSAPSAYACPCETCPQNITILMDGAFEEFNSMLEYHAAKYEQLNPLIKITLEQVEGDFASHSLQRRLLEDDSGEGEVSTWDGSVFPSQIIGALVNEDALWDLSDFVRSSFELDWSEMLPFFRHQLAGYDHKTRLIPLDGDVLSMYYRRDLFEQFNIRIPRTWEEYSEAAKFFHGLPLGPDGSDLYGSCVSRIYSCGNEYWTSLILSSMTQSMGTSSGFFLDPDSLDPLFGVAMEETLRLVSEQVLYGHPGELTEECLGPNFAFNQGNCALTYNWGNQITVPDSGGGYDIGVAATPGSQQVLDRVTGQLMNCTTTVCPYGVFYDDLGIVNQAPYSAFGGWASGVSNTAPKGRQYATADFFAYVSNSAQSLQDILPNDRSTFAQPYRYSHVTSSNWISAGFDTVLASEYTQSIRQINSENAVVELRVPPASDLREVVDEEVFDYLLEALMSRNRTSDEDDALRQEATVKMEQRIQNVISSENQNSDIPLVESYRTSLGYIYVSPEDSMNYIDEDYRDAAWGLSGLMCVTAVTLIVWTLLKRNNRVMKAFQPFLLIQSSVGLFLLSITIIPLGFDENWFEVRTLDVLCMLPPWFYVFGFTIFFCSVYSKIRECMKIHKEPQKHDVLMVGPGSALRLCTRLLVLNSTVLGLWTGIDPLKWERNEVEGGIVFEDGTTETYGGCRGGSASFGFALTLYVVNMMMCMIAILQAFKCRFLVLEYNEMQWLLLSIFPFLEVWAVGGPILVIVKDPTVVFVVLSMIVVVGTTVAGLAVFAPKDWYIRKFKYSNEQTDKKDMPERTSSAGILVLKHPTVSQLDGQ